jgi:putative flippase GtrA
VTAASPAPERSGLIDQLRRFVLVGLLAAAVDYGVYLSLLGFGTWVHLAKAISFVVGTTTAYLLNRRWTFNSAGGPARFAGFVALYGTTFGVNVAMNALALALLPESPLRVTAAWVIAQATATTINFLMLRGVIFRH